MTTEDDLTQKWFPTSLEAARTFRTKYLEHEGQYPNCRHHGKTAKDTHEFTCAKSEKNLTSCNDCRTCSNCNGRLGVYRSHADHSRSGAHVTEEYLCVNCGAYFVRQFFVSRPAGKNGEGCQVVGCFKHVQNGRRFTDDGLAGITVWAICESHYRKLQAWRSSEEKDPNAKPLIVKDGRLVEVRTLRGQPVKSMQRIELPDQEISDKYLAGTPIGKLRVEYGVTQLVIMERLKELGVWSKAYSISIGQLACTSRKKRRKKTPV